MNWNEDTLTGVIMLEMIHLHLNILYPLYNHSLHPAIGRTEGCSGSIGLTYLCIVNQKWW